MASRKNGQVELHHEVNVKRRVGDVRPWGIKMQEWLSEPFNFAFATLPFILVAIAAPFLLLPVIVLCLVAHLAVMSIKNVLPYRYPAYAGKDPSTKKKGDGILYIGAVRSDSPYERMKQCFLSDDDLRKHWLILGATGSGKSETLKGVFYNCLCWGSGFFMADGKADNKLPTDGYTMARAFGRDDSILYLNFLLSGKTPQEVSRSRRRRTNKLNPFFDAEADTIIQMGANLLPKAEGDGKAWQEKALAVWRAVINALCFKRDTQGMVISVSVIVDYLSLSRIEELYIEGYDEAKQRDSEEWSYGFTGIKSYLEVGLPGFSVEKLLRKHNRVFVEQPSLSQGRGRGAAQNNDQTDAPGEQHGYRVGQLMPVLNLLSNTYGHIFGDMFSEIDMVDVALHNRILFLLIPSLEKSSQEAENLGKLTISCLRVMMGKNLGSELEGSYDELIGSKATNSPSPYVVALDEIAYYFSDGIAVMFAQARSLGMSMIAAGQDLEMLTTNERAAETGAMIGNTVNKIFMKIDDPNKTWDLANKTIGKQHVATFDNYEPGMGSSYKRRRELRVQEMDQVTYKEMNALNAGEAVINTMGISTRINTFYVGDWLSSLKNSKFHVNRFLQVHPPKEEVYNNARFCTPLQTQQSASQSATLQRLVDILRYRLEVPNMCDTYSVFTVLKLANDVIDKEFSGISPLDRGMVLYSVIKDALDQQEKFAAAIDTDSVDDAGQSSSGGGSPHSASLFSTSLASGLSAVLDDHGLPDPLSLMRKPSSEVLGPVHVDQLPNEFGSDLPNSIQESDLALFNPGLTQSTESSTTALLHGYGSTTPDLPYSSAGYAGEAFDTQEELNPLDQILANQTKMPSANWVSDSLASAHRIIDSPRSADDSVVGVTEPVLKNLRSLEETLGSPYPAESAHAMQKIVAAQTTPDAIGKGDVSDAEIERFFNDEVED